LAATGFQASDQPQDAPNGRIYYGLNLDGTLSPQNPRWKPVSGFQQNFVYETRYQKPYSGAQPNCPQVRQSILQCVKGKIIGILAQ